MTHRSIKCNRTIIFLLIAVNCFISAFTVSAQTNHILSVHGADRKNPSDQFPFSVSIQPNVLIPVSDSSDLFSAGGAFSVVGDYSFRGNPQPFISGEINYSYLPVNDESSSISVAALKAGGGAFFWITPRMGLKLTGLAGPYFGFLNDGADMSTQISLSTGIALEYMLSPRMNISCGATYRSDIGLQQDLSVQASISYFLRGSESRKEVIQYAESRGFQLLEGGKKPEPGRGLDLAHVEINPIFPVFHKFYDDHPVGFAEIENLEDAPIEEINISFNIKQYMDSPKECPVPSILGPGERCLVEIMALLKDQVLEVTEATKVAADIIIEYRMDGEQYQDNKTVTLRLLDRNAMCWDDDRRAAAFVTAKDPVVLSLSKAVAGMVRTESPLALNPNLMTAMGMFSALKLYGISYVVDPRTPFMEYSKNASMVDYLQFPRQTLLYRSGDCDDLSILFAALLESVAIETAFITVPGHIFIAADTGLSRSEAVHTFGTADNLIIRNDRAWIPVETTQFEHGFLTAWNSGSNLWHEADASGTAGFYPLHAAWREYEPVGLPGEGEIILPDIDDVSRVFNSEVSSYITARITPEIARLEDLIRKKGHTPVLQNKLGILYARYGRLEQAEISFQQASENQDYAPALINLGNLYLLQDQPEKALTQYEKASVIEPRDSRILLQITRIHHMTGRRRLARESYLKLAAIDRQTAERYAYLGGTASEGRASDGSLRRLVLWME